MAQITTSAGELRLVQLAPGLGSHTHKTSAVGIALDICNGVFVVRDNNKGMTLAAVVRTVGILGASDISAALDARLDKPIIGNGLAALEHHLGMAQTAAASDIFIVQRVVNRVGVNVALPAVSDAARGVVSDIQTVAAVQTGRTELRLIGFGAAGIFVQTDVACEYLIQSLGKSRRGGVAAAGLGSRRGVDRGEAAERNSHRHHC